MGHITLISGLYDLDICDREFHPDIYMVLKIFCIFSVSIITSKRLFSFLKRINLYLRNSMTEANILSFNIYFD